MKVLLTGASGFLGSQIALRLQSTGHKVSLLLRPNSSLVRLAGRESHFIIGRPDNDKEIREFVRHTSPNVIIHTACSYGRSRESIIEITEANYRLGILLLHSTLETKNTTAFINCGTALERSLNIYSLTKHQFSEIGQLVATEHASKIRFINVVLQYIYGPNDSKTKFTTQVIDACRNNIRELKLTSGRQIRDFIFIEDAVSAFVTILRNLETFAPADELEVGSGVGLPIKDFVKTVYRLTRSSTILEFGALPLRAGEPMRLQADIKRMVTLGWTPNFDLEAGLKKALDMEMK